MQYQYFNEVLRLLFFQSGNNADTFISFFNPSSSLVGFIYCCDSKKTTHLSSSYRRIFGYCPENIQKGSRCLHNIVHPHDFLRFKKFLDNGNLKSIVSIDEYEMENPVSRLKCRLKHLKGFWKYCVFFTLEYKDSRTNNSYKAGFIMDERTILDQEPAKDLNSGYSTNNHKSVTARELEVLELIGEGMIARDIADKLHISESTVITHRKNLIEKLQVKNTAQLIKRGAELMLV